VLAYPGGRNPYAVDVRRVWGTPWASSVRVGSSYHRFYLDALLGAWALKAAVGFRPDVIHAHLHEGAFVAAPIARALRIPLVFDFQGSLTSEMLDHNFIKRGSPLFRPLRWLEGKINAQADVILTSSHNATDILEQQFGVAPNRIVAIPDGVNPAVFRPTWTYSEEQLRLERLRLGVPLGAKLVVYLGLLAEYQGSGHLLRAAKRLCDARDDVHFLLMGFPGERTYQSLAMSLGIAHRVTFTGGVPYEEAPGHLALGDVAVSPKLSETEGNGKLLNYMAVGLPTVTFSTPVSREILGPLGRYATLGDDASLADELARLIDDPQRPRLARALRTRAVELFSWEDQGQRILDVYGSLMRR
jgi:glycosyltransferase involved in cell wall biosynthesis